MCSQPLSTRTLIDEECAAPAIVAFSGACGVDCHLISSQGKTLFSSLGGGGGCRCCKAAKPLPPGCETVHLYGAYQAERFGGRYIYFCPHGLAWCASPVFVGGKLAGSLACGPALIMDSEDYLATQEPPYLHTPAEFVGVHPDLSRIPYKSPEVFGNLSALLVAVAVYIGDHSRLLVASLKSTEQQQHIGEMLHHLKATQAPPTYPLAKERELVHSIQEGDQPEARRLLNELLGHIFFCTGGDFPLMRTRLLELMSVLSRAAADGGADINQVLSLNHQFLSESAYLHSAEDLTIWITHVIERYTGLVFDLVDIKHKNLIYKAIDYLKQHHAERLTLEDTARYVGFSPTYFSKVFKDELDCTFNHYLNRLRIERSKSLLLDDSLSISEVCSMVGFEDQSYFIKVFRKHVGVTPGQYRRRQGRLDPSKERHS